MSVNETNETNETGVGGARADMLAHMGSLQQAAYTRPIEYQEGRAHGLKAIEVKNGPLRFVSMADRALDVCQFEYRGENLTFLSKPGLNGRNQFDTNGLEAQRSIMGGLFFTCGFENICAPYVTPEGGKYPAGSFPMHGRIRTTPAEHVSSDAHWTAEGDYVLEVSGEMREAELFGENLVMRRKITSVYGQPSITVEDEVTNESFRDEPLMWMYHCNFGWPLLAEGAEVVIPSRKATPRDETTAADDSEDTEKKSFPWDAVVSFGIVILAALVLLILYFVNPKFKKKLQDFNRSIKSELKKVVWSPKREVKKNTVIVLVFVAAFAILIGLLDFLFSKGIIALGKLF